MAARRRVTARSSRRVAGVSGLVALVEGLGIQASVGDRLDLLDLLRADDHQRVHAVHCRNGLGVVEGLLRLDLAEDQDVLLGVAEAGFFPGIIVYFSHWFVQGDRSRALSWLLVAVPFSLALGAPVSSLLLDVNWLGLVGWQWLFIVEGLPAVLLGVIVLMCFTDRPRHAKWLTQAERDHLENELAAEAAAKESVQKLSAWQALRLPTVWLLVLGVMIGVTTDAAAA